MSNAEFILALDQGTTSSRAILFDEHGVKRGMAQQELPQIFPEPGLIEHDAKKIWQDILTAAKTVMRQTRISKNQIGGIGISNQRETTVVWRRDTSEPIYNAIVWQDRRTAEHCRNLRLDGFSEMIRSRTGLIIDPYFSATKISWLLDNIDGARASAEKGELAFGTIDSWLLWNLTGGSVHATDATNASRTMLYDIHRQIWDEELCALFKIPMALLPEVRDSSEYFGTTTNHLFEAPITIAGIAGDQQAATVGQTCFQPGMIKSTYGTGCFIMLNTGSHAVKSQSNLLTTVAYRLKGQPTFALEGSIFVAGATIQWLRDSLRMINSPEESELLAESVLSTKGVVMVPAFTGLGAPYWDSGAKGAIFGLTRDTTISQIVRAALEAVCYQTRDLLLAMKSDAKGLDDIAFDGLRVDGGMASNNWLLQFLADILDIRVERPIVTEITALGAAYLAGLHQGIYPSTDIIAANWQRQADFLPRMEAMRRDELYSAWITAVSRVRSVA